MGRSSIQVADANQQVAPARVHFATTGFQCKDWEGNACVARMSQSARCSENSAFKLTERSADADLIILFESVGYKERNYAKFLKSHSLIREFGDRCFVYNYEDNPIAFMPGCYVSLPKGRHDPNLHRATGYLEPYNQFCVSPTAEIEPVYLFGFQGNPSSHRIRKEILKFDGLGGAKIASTTSWFNHVQEEKADYCKSLLECKFTLCPRGIGTASHRLFESMALGRSPVIVSDDWVPPSGPDWDSFAIFIEEKEVSKIPQKLSAHEHEWELRGALARQAYVEYFETKVALEHLVSNCLELQGSRTISIADLIESWSKDSFYRPYGQGFLQKAARKILAR